MEERSTAGRSALAEYQRRRQLYVAERRDRLSLYLAVAAGAAVVAGGLTALLTSAAGGDGGTIAEVGIVCALVGVAAVAVRYYRKVPEVEAWREDAESERRTARALDRLTRAGYTVLHDRVLPDSAGNIDHLVLGPSGVWVVEADAHRGLLRHDRAGLWAGRVPLRAKLGLVAWMAEEVTDRLLAGLPGGWEVGTQGVVAFSRAELPHGLVLLDGVVLLPSTDVAQYVLSAGVVLTPLDVAVLVGVAERAFSPYPVDSPLRTSALTRLRGMLGRR